MDPKLWRPVGVAAALVVLANGPMFFVTREIMARPGSWEDPYVWPLIVLTVVAGLLMAGRDIGAAWHWWRRDRRVAFAAAIALGGWATVSALWSLDPGVSLWRGSVYIGLPFLALAIGRLSAHELRLSLALMTGAIVVASVGVGLLWADVGLDDNDDLRGVMTSRNSLGPIAGLGGLVGVALFRASARRRGAALIGVCAVALVWSGSRTPWAALGLGLVVATVSERWGHDQRLAGARARAAAIVGALVGVAVGVAAVWDVSTVAQRREIWRLVGDRIADDPIQGVGWWSFWYQSDLHTHELLRHGSAHGSVPELLLGVGVVGLALWLVVIAVAVVRTGTGVRARPGRESWLWLTVVVFLLVENVTESFVLWFSYNWVLLVAAAVYGTPARRAELR